MSIWTNSARLLAAAVFLGTAGCVATAPSGPPQSVAVLGGSVIIAGPTGFCIDRSGSTNSNSKAFVLIGSCAAVAATAALPSPRVPAVLTASVIDGALPEGGLKAVLPEMTDFFRSRAGRAALSRSGNPDTVTVSEVSQTNDVMFIRASDRSAADGRAVEPDYWRAILSVNNRLVTLSVLGLVGQPTSAGEKQTLIREFVARIKSANAATSGEPSRTPGG